jgi:hypothetical protein
MIDREPPRIAVWLLKTWASPYQRESLVADLLEMYRDGRSRSWYWRQVVAALLVARLRAFRMLPRTNLGSVLLRMLNALILAGVIALGVGTFTQADTTRTDIHQDHGR